MTKTLKYQTKRLYVTMVKAFQGAVVDIVFEYLCNPPINNRS